MTTLATASFAQEPSLGAARTTSDGALREHLGLGVAIRLLRSPDPEERLRGAARAAAARTEDALYLLVRIASSSGPSNLDPRLPAEGVARSDPRALLAVIRGLSAFTDHEAARSALEDLVAAPSASFALLPQVPQPLDPAGEEAVGARRVFLARRQAALVLAATGQPAAIEALTAIARGIGPGQGPALEALEAYPPKTPNVFGGVALTTAPMVALASRASDLRTLDAVLGLLASSEPALRAAALASLGEAGDGRVLEPARAALRDPDPRVRTAACEALVRLQAPDAGRALAELVSDPATALEALRLGEGVQDESFVGAAVTRALVSADLDLRLAAIAALGRQKSEQAVHALSDYVQDDAAGNAAAFALARSPEAGAMAALERLAGTRGDPSFARRVARAYFVRRTLFRATSPVLEGLIERLARSQRPADRAVATLVRVTLGQEPLERPLRDRDPRVRRAAAAGALSRADRRALDDLLHALIDEPDERTRLALSAGLALGDPDRVAPTTDLVARVAAGDIDAPLAAKALAARAADLPESRVLALLASPDPAMRAQAARGAALSGSPKAGAWLARAYAVEGDDAVRRALVRALGALGGSAEARRELAWAARAEPDVASRAWATRNLDGESAGPDSGLYGGREVAWLTLSPVRGSALPPAMGAMVEDSRGVVWPVVFDDDGVAIVPGVSAGVADVRLAPRLPTYSASGP